ncbi:protein kinase domain-containing protein [Parendozoicomonas haliclonae]|uniref:Serine/threonine-protein kinase PknB n=1 Tax=Parendozoicomonas haliclonae TaxID=1960125 RepID=A0A1X7AIG0_9GAMM|nr:protein kinase [Parendozoicomonas haliclonae]SMA43140.1 Serine/threonine-protein kinase PknB [Parendozoicomonas haliclonae]
MENRGVMADARVFARINELSRQSTRIMNERPDGDTTVGLSGDGKRVMTLNHSDQQTRNLRSELNQLQQCANRYCQMRGFHERSVSPVHVDDSRLDALTLSFAMLELKDSALYVGEECQQLLGDVVFNQADPEGVMSSINQALARLKTPMDRAVIAGQLLRHSEKWPPSPALQHCRDALTADVQQIREQRQQHILSRCEALIHTVSSEGSSFGEYSELLSDLAEEMTQLASLDEGYSAFVGKMYSQLETMRALTAISSRSSSGKSVRALEPLEKALAHYDAPPKVEPSPPITPERGPVQPSLAEDSAQHAMQGDDAAETSGQDQIRGAPVVREMGKLGEGVGGLVSQIETAPGKVRARKIPNPKTTGQTPEHEQLREMAQEWQYMAQLNHPHILHAGRDPIARNTVVVQERDMYVDRDGYLRTSFGDHRDHNNQPIDDIDDDFVFVDSVQENEIAGLQMELTDGGLDKHMDNMVHSERVRCCLQLMDAVRYMHQQGVGHLDLKPDNILYKKGEGIKVSDFGLSQPISPKGVDQSGIFNAGFCPPETHSGRYVDANLHDSWSTALTLINVLTGMNPMWDDPAIKQEYERLGPPNMPYRLHPDVINGAIKRCLDNYPKQLGPIRPMLWSMLNPDPNQRMDVYDAMNQYGGAMEGWQRQLQNAGF